MMPTEHQRRREELFVVSVFALGSVAFTCSFFMRSTDDLFALAAVVISAASRNASRSGSTSKAGCPSGSSAPSSPSCSLVPWGRSLSSCRGHGQ